MVGGFNTNVRYQGRVFHVQTEDSGHQNPLVVTLLYEGGAILYSRKRGYEELLTSETLDSEVRTIMEEQHRGLLQELKNGSLDGLLGGSGDDTRANGVAPPAFGEGVVTDRSLAEVVLEHLAG